MSRLAIVALSLAAACGGSDTDPDPVPGQPDAAASSPDASGDVVYLPCNFPAELGPNLQSFMCHAVSATECEVSNPPAFTVDVCSDSGAPDFTFRRNPGDNSVVTTVASFVTTSSGAITGGGLRVFQIPDDTSTEISMQIDQSTYAMFVQFNAAAETTEITSFDPI